MTEPADSSSHEVRSPRGPGWPERFRSACTQLRGDNPRADARAMQEARSNLWLDLNSILFHYLRIHGERFGGVAVEDLEDLASQKCIELMQRLESGSLNFDERDPGEILAFFSSVARNGLLHVLRKAGHGAEPQEIEIPDGNYGRWIGERKTFAPEARAESREFATAMQECAGQLEGRARLIWFFRVFYDMRSKDIAQHPEVQLKASHVDVILQRARNAVKTCMQSQGHDTASIPAGVLPRLWRAFRLPMHAPVS